MATHLLDNQTAPTTPASGKSVLWIDSTTKKFVDTDDGGHHWGTLSRNNSTASQALGTGDTYVTNSGLLIPSFSMQAGQLYRWTISLSKTAAGVAVVTVNVRAGTNQSTGDALLLALTTLAAEAQSALVAGGVMTVFVGVRNIGASAVIAGAFGFTQTYQATAGNLALGGGVDGISGTFNSATLAGSYVGLSINAGAASAWTTSHVAAELIG